MTWEGSLSPERKSVHKGSLQPPRPSRDDTSTGLRSSFTDRKSLAVSVVTWNDRLDVTNDYVKCGWLEFCTENGSWMPVWCRLNNVDLEMNTVDHDLTLSMGLSSGRAMVLPFGGFLASSTAKVFRESRPHGFVLDLGVRDVPPRLLDPGTWENHMAWVRAFRKCGVQCPEVVQQFSEDVGARSTGSFSNDEIAGNIILDELDDAPRFEPPDRWAENVQRSALKQNPSTDQSSQHDAPSSTGTAQNMLVKSIPLPPFPKTESTESTVSTIDSETQNYDKKLKGQGLLQRKKEGEIGEIGSWTYVVLDAAGATIYDQYRTKRVGQLPQGQMADVTERIEHNGIVWLRLVGDIGWSKVAVDGGAMAEAHFEAVADEYLRKDLAINPALVHGVPLFPSPCASKVLAGFMHPGVGLYIDDQVSIRYPLPRGAGMTWGSLIHVVNRTEPTLRGWTFEAMQVGDKDEKVAIPMDAGDPRASTKSDQSRTHRQSFWLEEKVSTKSDQTLVSKLSQRHQHQAPARIQRDRFKLTGPAVDFSPTLHGAPEWPREVGNIGRQCVLPDNRAQLDLSRDMNANRSGHFYPNANELPFPPFRSQSVPPMRPRNSNLATGGFWSNANTRGSGAQV